MGAYTWDILSLTHPDYWSSVLASLLTTTSVQFSSVAQSCLTLWDPMDCSTPGFPVHHQLPELAQTHVHWGGDAIQPSHHPSPPAFSLASIRFFHSESFLRIRWLKYWSFSFSISHSSEYSGLIFFRIDECDSPCSSRDSQEFFPTPQFKSIHFLALSFLLFSPPTTHTQFFFNCIFSFICKLTSKSLHQNLICRLNPGGSVVKTLQFQGKGHVFDP